MSKGKGRTIRVVAFDADDTLWHNMPLFTVTQEKFRGLLVGHGDPTEIGEHLFETEVRNLQRYGYGIKAFTLSMIETALELTERQVTGEQIAAILELGRQMLASPIELLPQVRETVERLSVDYELMLLTKGDLFDQEAKLARSGLGALFRHVTVVSEKNRAAYERILARHDLSPEELVMIGNSVKSDILPALAAGSRAVYVPYHLTWAHEEAEVGEADPARYAEIAHLGLLPYLLANWSALDSEKPL
jgi:putative hydrolase of the HAD superfamily